MDRRHAVPRTIRDRARRALNGEEVLFAVAANLDLQGRFVERWAFVTAQRIAVFGDTGLVGTHRISRDEHYRAHTRTGSGFLEASRNGHTKVLARYSMEHVSQFAAIAEALNRIKLGKAVLPDMVPEPKVCRRCGSALPEAADTCPVCVRRLAVLFRLMGVSRAVWPAIFMSLLLFAAAAALAVLGPYVTRVLVDDFLVPRRHEAGPIALLVGLLGVIYAVTAAVDVVRGRLWGTIGSRMNRDLRSFVFGKLQALSLAYVRARRAGDLLNRVGSDTERVQRFIWMWASEGVRHVFLVVAVGVVLVVRDPSLAALVIAPVPVVIFLFWLLYRPARYAYTQELHLRDVVRSFLQDVISGMREVKAFGRERREVRRFQGMNRQLRSASRGTARVWALVDPLMAFILMIGHFLVLYFGGRMLLGGRLPPGELIQFSIYAGMLYGPLLAVSQIPRAFVNFTTAADRIFTVIDQQNDVQEPVRPVRERIGGRIRFESVTFGYRHHEPVLDDVSLDISEGEMIGLVGHSGAGKTTMINLLMRLYDPDKGRLTVDDMDVREYAQAEFRAQMGVVLQETFLFSASVLDNIRFSRPDATERDVIAAARVANAHEFIMGFPDGYDTMVGERGMRLSGGERQRVAIARAILHDPRILVLDEATSAVDLETEEMIQNALFALFEGRTTIAIAHRLSTLSRADRLVVVDDGRIAEVGSHRELMEAGGLYHGLVQAQRALAGIRAVG